MNLEKTHYATVESIKEKYEVLYQDSLIVESAEVVRLTEHYNGKVLPAVVYFPRDAFLQLKTNKENETTYCSIKGHASYWTYRDAKMGIWCYENPMEEVSIIQDLYAFDQNKGFRVTPA